MKVPTLQVGQQFQCGASANERGEYVGLVGFGRGERLIRGSAYIAGPLMIGNPSSWIARENFNEANVMIARCGNTEADPESIPSIFKITNKDSGFETRVNDIELGDTGGGEVGIQFYSSTFNQVNLETYTITTPNLELTGDCTHDGNLIESNLVDCTGESCAWSGSSINVQGWKGFDIQHPSKEGHRLRHICLEGPEGAIYYRGRTNNNVITLPLYWKDLVDPESITVSLTPIGAHQDIIVKRFDAENIHLQSQGELPINCFFHVFGERIDGERLVPEYEGKSPEDYPGDNTQYSIAGYHYDRRTL